MLVMAFALFGLFVLSIIARDVKLILLVVGLILTAAGGFLHFRFPAPQKQQPERFRLLKKKPPKGGSPNGPGAPVNQPGGHKGRSGKTGGRSRK